MNINLKNIYNFNWIRFLYFYDHMVIFVFLTVKCIFTNIIFFWNPDETNSECPKYIHKQQITNETV